MAEAARVLRAGGGSRQPMRPAITSPPASYALFSIAFGGRGFCRKYCRMLGEAESAAWRDPGWGADVSARGVVLCIRFG